MTNKESTYNISQEFEIIPHQKGKAYPIGVKEWEFIKSKLNEIDIDINIFFTVGFLLLGASASCLITIIATKFTEVSSKYLTWSLFGVSLIGGLLSVYFANDKRKQESSKPKEIINQMNLIESRFNNSENENSN